MSPHRLLRATIDPEIALRQMLRGCTDVERAAVFGSDAARASGEPGPPPSDIDLLLIGDIPFEDGDDLAVTVGRDLDLPVNPVIRTPEEWDNDETGFTAEVQARPKVVPEGSVRKTALERAVELRALLRERADQFAAGPADPDSARQQLQRSRQEELLAVMVQSHLAHHAEIDALHCTAPPTRLPTTRPARRSRQSCSR